MPSIVSGTVLFISYNIVNYIVQPVLYTYLSNSNVKADVWVNYSESYRTVYNMLVPYNSREWFRMENPVLFPIGVKQKLNENTRL